MASEVRTENLTPAAVRAKEEYLFNTQNVRWVERFMAVQAQIFQLNLT